jgi:hypothetical protein
MTVAPIGVGHTSGKRAIRYWEPADRVGTTVQQRAIYQGIDGASRPCSLNWLSTST